MPFRPNAVELHWRIRRSNLPHTRNFVAVEFAAIPDARIVLAVLELDEKVWVRRKEGAELGEILRDGECDAASDLQAWAPHESGFHPAEPPGDRILHGS